MNSASSVKNYFRPGALLLLLSIASILLLLLSMSIHYALKINGMGLLLVKGEIGQVLSPHNGTLEDWLVEEGEHIHAGQAIARLRINNDDFTLKTLIAQNTGVIAEIVKFANTQVKIGEPIAFTTAFGDVKKDLQAVAFVSSLQGKKIAPGMLAKVSPSITSKYREGQINARVIKVGKLPTSISALQSLVKTPELASFIRSKIEAEPFMVILSLEQNPKNITGYDWDGSGPNFSLDSGIFVEIEIIHEKPRILALIWPSLNQLLFAGK